MPGKYRGYRRFACVGLTLLALSLWFWVPAVNAFIQQSITALASLDQQRIELFVRSWGTQAATVSFFLMILQAIIAPLPAFVITFANASLFGAFWGGVLSWSSAMAGAALCFVIARLLGREIVEKITGKTVLKKMDAFFLRHGKHTILLCRLLPFVPFDPVSYAAGLTSIRFRHFFGQPALASCPPRWSTPGREAC